MARIVVVVGSVRNGRKGLFVAKWVAQALRNRGHSVTLTDPLEHEDLLVMRQMYKSQQSPSKAFSELRRVVKEADGYVAVTPEYNHSFSGAIKNALDVFLEEYFFKPFGIVTYSTGGFGGVRAGEHLRCVVAEMGASAIPSSLAVSRVQNVFSEDGTLIQEEYSERLETFLEEFEWYVDALATARKKGVPY